MMFGLDFSIPQTAMHAQSGYTFDFSTGQLLAQLSLARASAGTGRDASGNIVPYGAGEPRFNLYTGDGALAGLIIEEERTNIVESAFMGLTNWSASGVTATPLTLGAMGVFPGVNVASSGASWNRLNTTVDVVDTLTYSATIYCRFGSSGKLRIVFRDPSASTESVLAVTSSSTTVVSTVAGGLTPVSNTVMADGITYEVVLLFTAIKDGEMLFGLGPNTGASGDDVVLLAAQLEVGTTPTSFIETTSALLTRLADNVGTTGINGLFDVTWLDSQSAPHTLNAQSVSDGYWPSGAAGVIHSMAFTPSA